jgi:DNA excision repair protein ERCC-2
MYLEQHQYMRSIKQILDAGGGHGLIEMPTGTGKTVCLLSLITSYQYSRPGTGKLVYCTRTVPEMNHVMEELGIVLAYRAEQLHLQQREDDIENQVENVEESSSSRKRPRRIYSKKKMGVIDNDGKGAGGSGVLAVCLSSRRNMCIHKRVMSESDREAVDSACRSMTSTWVMEANQRNPGSVETCEYFDNFHSQQAITLPSGVYDLEELKKYGESRGWCPYFLTRQAINHANILVFNYQYMLDPKVARMVSKELEAESIIVFDEAHNIDSVCIEALSVTINDRGLEQATRSLGRLSSEVSRLKASDSQRLQNEYNNLVNGLIEQGLLDAPINDASLGSVSIGLHTNILCNMPPF